MFEFKLRKALSPKNEVCSTYLRCTFCYVVPIEYRSGHDMSESRHTPIAAAAALAARAH